MSEKCIWIKEDFMKKPLRFVREHLKKCKDPDCLGKTHLRIEIWNSINVNAKRHRVWTE